MIVTRPADLPDPQAADSAAHRSSQTALVTALSHAMRLALLACAGALLQIGWLGVWVLSYRLTHGDGFSYQFLTDQAPVWEKLQDALTLANTLAPGIEPPASIDILVY